MIRRVLVAAVALAVGVIAWVMPAPAVELPSFPVVSPVADRDGRGTSVSYCPWAHADDTQDTSIAVTGLAASDVFVSFPGGGEIGDRTELQIPEPGAVVLPIGSVVRKGAAPTVVEVTEGPAAASALARREGLLTGGVCPGSIPKVWQLPGGSTREGETLTLRLFNPFPEDAKLSIGAVSEFGVEGHPQFEAVTVASRGWRDIDLSTLLSLREQLALTVSTTQGLIIPAMMLQTGAEVATWAGTGQSNSWQFPLVGVQDLAPTLVVRNSGGADVAFDVDVVGQAGSTPAVVSEVVPAGGEVRVPVGGLADGLYGVRVQGDGPLSAVLVGRGATGLAASAGVPQMARRWLVPGLGSGGPERHDLWLMNSGGEAATITVRALDSEGWLGEVEKVSLPAGTVARLTLDRPGAAGAVVESLTPFSLAWSAEAGGAVVYSTGLPADG